MDIDDGSRANGKKQTRPRERMMNGARISRRCWDHQSRWVGGNLGQHLGSYIFSMVSNAGDTTCRAYHLGIDLQRRGLPSALRVLALNDTLYELSQVPWCGRPTVRIAQVEKVV